MAPGWCFAGLAQFMACPASDSARGVSRRRADGRGATAASSATSACAWRSSARRPVVIRTSESWAHVSVSEVAVFDGPYNIRLHPTHGARSRVPRVPALRWYRDSVRRG